LFCQEGGRVVLVDSDSGAMRVAVSHIQNTVPGARVVAVGGGGGKGKKGKGGGGPKRERSGAMREVGKIAANPAYEPPAAARRETWEKIIAVNLMSYAYFIRQAITDLRASGRGSIINISSTHAINPRAGMGQYDVTKAGIVSLTRTLAFEEAKHGIRVNAVCPRLTLTPFHLLRAKAAGRSRQDLDREATEGCLLGRWADPREVAYPILWLASDEASYVTGSVLMVDGGRLVR